MVVFAIVIRPFSPNSIEPGIITPSSSAAAATTTFMVEPGSYVSVRAIFCAGMINGFLKFLFGDVLDHLINGQSERLPCSRNLFTEAFREYRSTERVALKNCQSFFSVQLGFIPTL